MNVRTPLLAASVALLAFAGCGGGRDGGNDAGCTTCSVDGGSDGGQTDGGQTDGGQTDGGQTDGGQTDGGQTDGGQTDGGQTDGGGTCEYIPYSDGGMVDLSTDKNIATPVTIAQLRYGLRADGGTSTQWGGHASLTGVVVQTIDYQSDAGDAHFWVVDPNDPSSGFWIYKRAADAPYVAVVGDVVDVDGFLGSDPNYYVPDGRRLNLQNLYSGGAVQKPIVVTSQGTSQTVADNSVDSGCTFDAREGDRYFPQDKQAFAGTRVHFNGPLTLTNPNPIAMGNVRLEQDGGASVTSYRGFEVTGGILVATSETFSADGGFGDQNGRCDWAELARADGGLVTFPDGISGVWDTFTNTVCDVQSDAGSIPVDNAGCAIHKSGGNYYPAGYIPNPTDPFPTRGTDGGVVLPQNNQDYTFVLYPQNCADLPGDAGAGVTP